VKTDRELLELAAKAADLCVLPIHGQDDGKLYDRDLRQWNPLEDADDNLRLAVKLRMSIAIFDTGAHVSLRLNGVFTSISQRGDDVAAATRRAVVLAAAATQGEIT
jgi:hypothetical protein